MPNATLLLREEASASLTTLVEKSQQRKPPLPEYELVLTSAQLDLIRRSAEPTTSADEGFESDIDSLSIVSSDGSIETKTNETDSANGSAHSDSDTELTPTTTNELTTTTRNFPKESHNLVDCVCYTDVKFPHVLLFIIKHEALVFKFDDLNNLKSFYLNFTALKAVTNQKAYSKNLPSAKFNLLQRTDRNGVTHIEITREPEVAICQTDNREATNIISLNTPEDGVENLILVKKNRSHESNLKVWTSAEDLLNVPKRPERRKKPKAPQPPAVDVLRGEYVRVNVTTAVNNRELIAKSQMDDRKPLRTNLVALLGGPRLTNRSEASSTSMWTNSVPRLLKKQRSKSETRGNFHQPMAYRYIDTTPSSYHRHQMGSRLFGLSGKLRDFGDDDGRLSESRWSGVGEYQSNQNNLKSVIKKNENRKKNSNEKKVTFSAYTTVQVV